MCLYMCITIIIISSSSIICIYTYVCMYIYIYIYTYICMCTYAFVKHSLTAVNDATVESHQRAFMKGRQITDIVLELHAHSTYTCMHTSTRFYMLGRTELCSRGPNMHTCPCACVPTVPPRLLRGGRHSKLEPQLDSVCHVLHWYLNADVRTTTRGAVHAFFSHTSMCGPSMDYHLYGPPCHVRVPHQSY